MCSCASWEKSCSWCWSCYNPTADRWVPDSSECSPKGSTKVSQGTFNMCECKTSCNCTDVCTKRNRCEECGCEEAYSCWY